MRKDNLLKSVLIDKNNIKDRVSVNINNNVNIITVCSDYSFVFEKVLSSWIRIGINPIVSTNDEDVKTINLCKRNGFRYCTIPKQKYIRGNYINKAIIETCKYQPNWILSLDCDVWFPYDVFNGIDFSSLNREYLYGIPHVDLNERRFKRYIKTGRYRGRKKKYAMGPFQLFNKVSLVNKRLKYPDSFNVSRRGKGGDFYFARNFKRLKLHDTPIICCNFNNPNGV